jgi:hypothetical protein
LDASPPTRVGDNAAQRSTRSRNQRPLKADVSGNEPGIDRGLVAYLRSIRCARRGGRLATAGSTLGFFFRSARQAHEGRPDEQLHFYTLPMTGCVPPPFAPVVRA